MYREKFESTEEKCESLHWRIKIVVCTLTDNMLCFFNWQRNVPLRKILHLYHLCNRVMVVLADRNNYLVTNGNIVLISKVIILLLFSPITAPSENGKYVPPLA